MVGHTFFDSEYSAVEAEGGNLITKRPNDIWHWREIREKHPETKFIVTIRDPRCMVTSRHPIYPRWTASHDHYLAGHGPDAMVYPYGGVIPVARKIRELQEAEDVLTVRYEDLVDDPQSVQQRIGALGLVFKARFDSFHEREPGEWPALRGLRPVDPENKHRWKHEPERIRQQFSECPALFDLVEEYGYEADRRWFEPFRILEDGNGAGSHHAAGSALARR